MSELNTTSWRYLDDFEIAEPFEDDDVKQAIIDDSLFKKWEGPSVKAAVSDENKRSLLHRKYAPTR